MSKSIGQKGVTMWPPMPPGKKKRPERQERRRSEEIVLLSCSFCCSFCCVLIFVCLLAYFVLFSFVVVGCFRDEGNIFGGLGGERNWGACDGKTPKESIKKLN